MGTSTTCRHARGHRPKTSRTRTGTVCATVLAAMLAGGGVANAERLDPQQLQELTDTYLFATSLTEFGQIRAQQPHSGQLDWGSDGCTLSPDKPFGHEFRDGCDRHDFGYRNYQLQERFTDQNRKRIDGQFRDDLHSTCEQDPDVLDKATCHGTAEIYYAAVRQFGGLTGDTSDAIDHGTTQLS